MDSSRLLLAEDDEALASLLEEYLLEAGYSVVVYKRGDTALAALQKGCFDLVLSDVVMPGADGLSLLAYVQEQKLDTLVLLMTGYSGIEDALSAVEQGAYDFVSKPFQLPEIRVRLDNAARYQQLMRRWKEINGEVVITSESKNSNGLAAVKAYGRQNSGGWQ
ncbi:response regulator [Mariprofundus ferrooxydans]|uniref:response regulator n=1 Tax=Mariprofundus ferrooxydans TaxID=314344 RepID=UPI001F0E236B|nr:response regulator [Mariprofundus ferrooxydans]